MAQDSDFTAPGNRSMPGVDSGKARQLPIYPADHQVGMKVPKGGSDCAKCEYLDRETMKDCTQKDWIKWNGGDSRIPVAIDEYCCDFFGIGDSQ